MSAPAPAPPRWIGINGVAVVTVASFVSCGIALVLQLFKTLPPLPTHASTAIGLVAGGLVARSVLAPSKRVWVRALLSGLIAGPLVGLAVAAVAGAPLERAALGFVLGPLFALTAVPFGLLARPEATAKPLDTFDRALVTAASFLLLAGVPAALAQAAPGDHGQDGRLAMALAAVCLGAVALRDIARRRWLKDLLASKLPGWGLTLVEEKGDFNLPPYLGLTGGSAVITCASSEASTAGPFRAAPPVTRRLARLDPRETQIVVVARAVLAFLGLAFALGLVFIPRAPYRAYREDLVAHAWTLAPTTPTPIAGLDVPAVTSLSVAQDTACARYADGTLHCWGNQAGYVLGSARDDAGRHTPERRAGLEPSETMAVGFRFMCALRKAGESRAQCWGLNREGEVGDATTRPHLDPIELGPPSVTQLALGGRYTLALTKEGAVHRWGPDPQVEQSWPTRDDLVRPALVGGLADIVQIAAGENHACAIDRAGDVHCWGVDVTKDTAMTTAMRRQRPTRMAGLPGRATALALGTSETWARVVDGDGHAIWWGWGTLTIANETGFREPLSLDAPHPIPASEPLTQVRLGRGNACALREDGAVTCWRSGSPSSERLPPGSAVELAGDEALLCARGATTVWCWRDS